MRNSLAFVDVETTGLSPGENRIREIGVVLVDQGKVNRWTSFLRIPSPDRRRDEPPDDNPVSPRFEDVASDLSNMLTGRLVVAHNARFDYGFLSAEFARIGVDFQPGLLCSLMLSRQLCPQVECHD